MKAVLRHYIVDTFSLFFMSKFFQGIVFERGEYTLLIAGLVLMVSGLVVKPIINLLILPLNLVTFGVFKWVSSVVALYIVTLIVPGFAILKMAFGGFTGTWIDLPTFELHGLIAVMGFSFGISIFSSIMNWLVK